MIKKGSLLYRANIRSVNETRDVELLGAEELQSLKSMPKYLLQNLI